MGGEKTERATSKKRRDARRKGQVRRSQDVNTAFCAIVMFGLLFAIWPWFVTQLTGIFTAQLSRDSIMMASGGLSYNEISALFVRLLLGFFGVMFPILGASFVAGVAINVLQIGFMFTTETMKFKPSKINPINGFKQLFSPRKLVDLTKNILKIILIGLVAYTDYMSLLEKFGSYVGQDVYVSFIDIMRTAFLMALKMCIVMVFIAVAVFLYQWWKYEKDLKMTKQEVKDEYKMMEGDPKIKAKIKHKQLQMSSMRMMQQVPEADVVITNPTHYAVALAYKEKEQVAPVVVAKGQDYVAHKIREKAMENGIQIVENPPLAQSLFTMCDVYDEIPEDLFQAVADVLVFVYRQKGRIR